MEAGIQTPFLRDQIRMSVEKRIEAFEKGYRQNVALLGPPGIGKTHLLSSLFTSFSGRPGIVPVYLDARAVDVDQLIDRWIGGLLSGIFLSQAVQPPSNFHSLLLAADPIIPKTTDRIRRLKKSARREKNAAAVRELFSLTDVLSEEAGKKILMMIDEFHALESLPSSDPFALWGKEIMVTKNTLYLVASSNAKRAEEIFREKLSLLFGNFEVIRLEPFDMEETARYLSDRFSEKKLTAQQKKFFMHLTKGHPLYLEILSDRLASCLDSQSGDPFTFLRPAKEVVSNAWIREAFQQELASRQSRLALIFERRLEECRRLSLKDGAAYLKTLLAIAQGKRKALAISAYIDKRTSETKKILKRLEAEEKIVKRGSFYTLQDPLFQFWLCEVWERRGQQYTPDEISIQQAVGGAIRREWEHLEEEGLDLSARLEALFKEFRNDVVEINQKKMCCPQFSEIALRPAQGRIFPLLAKNSKVRWICQMIHNAVKEEDVTFFLDELKRSKKRVQRKIMIALQGIDQNAKLMAQEAGIQLWDLKDLNALFELYDLPQVIFYKEKEEDGSTLGALAQSVHSA